MIRGTLAELRAASLLLPPMVEVQTGGWRI
jgi:hypothetical protein